MAGRTAMITGASRGLGRYIARALADAGMNLVLAARSADALEELAGTIRPAGTRVATIPTDLEIDREIETLVEGADREFDAVDVLVNNAGITCLSRFHTVEGGEVEREIRINLVAPMLLTRRVLPGMLRRKRGHVVNISSIAGKAGPPHDPGYGASKAGLISFTESLRQEYHGTGVSASVICPGYVEEAGLYHDMRTATGARAPGLVGTSRPEAVSAAVVRAIRNDVPEIIVNGVPIRPLSTLAELFPKLGERLIRRLHAYDPFRQAVEGRASSGESKEADGRAPGATVEGPEAGKPSDST